MKTFLKLAWHPIPQPDRIDTSLRYTDILFGFVIRELFIRLEHWSQLCLDVKLHLVVGATLVIGSWIGYRRSLYRSGYEAKFFNLPLFRFVLDQIMLIFYFSIAVLTPTDVATSPPGDLIQHTIRSVLWVFVLYVLWDLLGIWMYSTKIERSDHKVVPRYPALKDSQQTEDWHALNWPGFGITLGSLIILLAIFLIAKCHPSKYLLIATTFLLLGYRWAKDIRTSYVR